MGNIGGTWMVGLNDLRWSFPILLILWTMVWETYCYERAVDICLHHCQSLQQICKYTLSYQGAGNFLVIFRKKNDEKKKKNPIILLVFFSIAYNFGNKAVHGSCVIVVIFCLGWFYVITSLQILISLVFNCVSKKKDIIQNPPI